MKPFSIVLCVFVCCVGLAEAAEMPQEAAPPPEEQFVGKFFDIQVPVDNYLFVKNVIAIFGNKWAPPTDDPAKREEAVWEHLLFSYEAFRRGITVDPQEVEQEVDKMLKAEKVDFDRKKDPEAYEKWAQEKIGAPAGFIENGVRHLLQIEKLRASVMESIDPPVSEREALQEFLNEYNTLGVELVQFDEKEDAQAFYRKVKSGPKAWEEEKLKAPKNFRAPGFVSTEFLMDLWKFPFDAVQRMMKMRAGSIHPPAPVYKGWGVFKVLNARPADAKEFPNKKQAYYEQIRRRKQFEGLDRWIKDLKAQAKTKIYQTQMRKEEGQ